MVLECMDPTVITTIMMSGWSAMKVSDYYVLTACTHITSISMCKSNQYILHQPFACNNAFLHSFVPRAVNARNSLPNSLVSSSLGVFKNSVSQYL